MSANKRSTLIGLMSGLLIAVGGVGAAANAQTPPPESGNCKVQLGVPGAATLSAQAATCHIDSGDPGPIEMGVYYDFTSSDGQEYEYSNHCNKSHGFGDCLKKISHTFKDPAGKQTFTVTIQAQWNFPYGATRRDDRSTSTTH